MAWSGGVVVNISKFPKSTNLKFSPLFLLTLCYLPVARLFWTPRTTSLPLNGTNDGIAAHIWAYTETCSTQTMDTGSSFTIIKSFGSHLHDRRISINIIIGYDPITIHKSISRRRYSSPITRFWGACFIIHSQSIHLIHSIALSLSHSCTHTSGMLSDGMHADDGISLLDQMFVVVFVTGRKSQSIS